jgi:hypothetical protein
MQKRQATADARHLPLHYWLVVLLGAVFTLARFSEAFLVLCAQDVELELGYVPFVMIVMNVLCARCDCGLSLEFSRGVSHVSGWCSLCSRGGHRVASRRTASQATTYTMTEARQSAASDQESAGSYHKDT